jgi:hypothetical protein
MVSTIRINPKWACQLYNQLRQSILEQELTAGARLPSIRTQPGPRTIHDFHSAVHSFSRCVSYPRITTTAIAARHNFTSHPSE